MRRKRKAGREMTWEREAGCRERERGKREYDWEEEEGANIKE